MTDGKAGATIALLRQVSTATVTMQLLKRGLRAVSMRGPTALTPGQPRLVGPAYTLRYVPMREDLSTVASLGDPDNPSRNAIEECPPGHVLVMDGLGRGDAGVLGDILAARLKVRGVAGAVTDAGVRDAEAIRPIGLPVWSAGPTPPANIGALAWGERQVRIGCGGVAVEPGDMIVADGDGVVVIPAALADEVARDGVEQERFERFVQLRVGEGRPVHGLYPPNEASRAEYEKWVADGEPA